jgi:hypothetical protein
MVLGNEKPGIGGIRGLNLVMDMTVQLTNFSFRVAA